jgi:putative addiction module component (TIGR02574 family)
MSIAEIRQLPLHEKLQMMEALWEDLRSHAEDLPAPAWHKELLDARRKAVMEGREEILAWDDIKDSLKTKRT